VEAEFGGRFMHVRGAIEVKRHLVFSELVLAAGPILRLEASTQPQTFSIPSSGSPPEKMQRVREQLKSEKITRPRRFKALHNAG
jgi:hypothetical protein